MSLNLPRGGGAHEKPYEVHKPSLQAIFDVTDVSDPRPLSSPNRAASRLSDGKVDNTVHVPMLTVC